MIVIDTHILLWWFNEPKKLSTKALEILKKERKSGLILVSAISIWEICLLIKKDRISLTTELDNWISNLESLSYIQFIPVDTKVAAHSANLPGFNADPADCMIIATAREHNAKLLTADSKIRKYSHVQTVW